jgi:hypothetical protein
MGVVLGGIKPEIPVMEKVKNMCRFGVIRR